jgi:DsbC/DsbD-like thiol-disulfide interchange protein
MIGEAAHFFHIGAMWFRSILAGLACSLALGGAGAAEKPWRVSLVGDRFDGAAWHTGVLIELDPGWKTYWRMPGEAGVPPEFTWVTSLPAKVEAHFPAPRRYADASGETVGYEGEVLFPVTVTPEAPAGNLRLGLDLFFAVCKDICIPARAEAAIDLGSQARDPLGSARVEQAEQARPARGDTIASASLADEAGKPVLLLMLKDTPEDIFVETQGSAYFRKPSFSADGREARLAIDNLSDPAALSGSTLSLTYWLNGRGLEQAVTLP